FPPGCDPRDSGARVHRLRWPVEYMRQPQFCVRARLQRAVCVPDSSRDRAAYEAYTRTELFRGVTSHPNLSNVVSRGFDILEEPTRQTRGLPARTAAA